MPAPEPVITIDRFVPEREALVALLAGLSDEEWGQPTVCEGWSVKDVALHILGDDLSLLSRRRDDHRVAGPSDDSWESLVAFLNEWNERWVESARRLSDRLLIDLLRTVGERTQEYYESLDLQAVAEPVNWAGPEPAPVWLDVAREYTERWLHQQQIRDAVAKPGLDDRRFLGPVIATFVHALPVAYRDVDASEGTAIAVVVEGGGGGEWSVVRAADGWRLARGTAADVAATVTIDQDTAWRRWTKGLDREAAASRSRIDGDSELGGAVLDAVSIIA